MKDEKTGRFISGIPENKYPVGTVRVRTRYKRRNEKRNFIKVSEPNEWVLFSRYVWENKNGKIRENMLIHHKDGNKLNDSIDNLELVSKSEHISIHRDEFEKKRIELSAKARRKIRWSTKSKTKRTGRPASYTDEQMNNAISAWISGEGTKKDIASKFCVQYTALIKATSKSHLLLSGR